MPVRGHGQCEITGNGSPPRAIISELGGFYSFLEELSASKHFGVVYMHLPWQQSHSNLVVDWALASSKMFIVSTSNCVFVI